MAILKRALGEVERDMLNKNFSFTLIMTYLLISRIHNKLFYRFPNNKLRLLLNLFLIGFWLGVLRRRDFHLMDEFNCNNSGMWVSQDYNKGGLFDWEKLAIDTYFQGCKRLMVIAAGGGREALALHNLAYQVDGFECNPRLVKFASELFKKEKLDLSMRLIPRDCGPNNEEIYDGIIVGWGSYMLIQGKGKRVRLIKELRAKARKGGPILLSFWLRVHYSENSKIPVSVANTIRFCFCRELLEHGDWLDRNFRHLFTAEEVAAELQEGGFRLIDFRTGPCAHAVGIAC